ncbi:hypothetical protein [Paenibacillus sp. BGI2013]|nr:hypothetical protein [Paenibacillus sp. BGI2013]
MSDVNAFLRWNDDREAGTMIARLELARPSLLSTNTATTKVHSTSVLIT